MFFHEQLDKTWGCSEGPGDNIQYKFRERAVPLLPQTTKQHWHPEAQKLLCHLELVGRGKTVVTQPGRVLLTGSQAENNV